MFKIRAGYGFVGKPLCATPAAQSIADSMSESSPPHLPNARACSSQPDQVVPAIPRLLLVIAPSTPLTRVPCQELVATVQPLNCEVCVSACVTQSPGSDASALGPLDSLPALTLLTKS